MTEIYKFLKSLIYKDGWKKKDIYRLEPAKYHREMTYHKFSISIKAKLTIFFGPELPDQVPAFNQNCGCMPPSTTNSDP